MFTGLIQFVGRVVERRANLGGVRLLIDAAGWSYKPAHGESIAVSGVCLTHAPAAGESPGVLAFDVIHETLGKTTLGDLAAGSRVNLESCLTPTSHIGGHFVQGHVDRVAKITDIHTAGDDYRITIATDADFFRYVIPTGSIAVDGVSLTIARIDSDAKTFAVALIPTTLQLTTLGDRKAGDRVNLEADVLVKAVVHNLPQTK
ncbi:MAG: riboflavin synthase [Planctomycetes bacterium]|nr:riboflavin synthase [Planctomycetota bacterium]